MTDKQIIIDGVNVKGCKRRIGKDNYCRYYKRPCSENNYNCVWKKYLRKEQECEELKNELHKNFEEKDKLHLIIDRLLEASGYDTNTASAEDFEDVYENMRYKQQQLEQLKAENELLKINNAQFIKDNEFLAKRNSKLKAENDLYKNAHKTRRRSYENALIEIKEIAKKKCLGCTNFCNDDNIRFCAIKQILQKISEVM